VDGVRERIENTGAALCYLPPYSPNFNLIEQCSAQLKQKLRKLRALSVSALERALDHALPALTAISPPISGTAAIIRGYKLR